MVAWREKASLVGLGPCKCVDRETTSPTRSTKIHPHQQCRQKKPSHICTKSNMSVTLVKLEIICGSCRKLNHFSNETKNKLDRICDKVMVKIPRACIMSNPVTACFPQKFPLLFDYINWITIKWLQPKWRGKKRKFIRKGIVHRSPFFTELWILHVAMRRQPRTPLTIQLNGKQHEGR